MRNQETQPWSLKSKEIPAPDMHAIKAVALGNASAEQQRRAIKVIVEQIAGTYDMSFHPENARATDFSEGKRHVGRMIVGLINTDIKKLNEADKRKDNNVGSNSGSSREKG